MLRYLIPISLLLCQPLLAQAQTQDKLLSGQRLAATCANCHGSNGRPASAVVPALAGMREQDMLTSMKAFRDGSRPATVMHQLAKGYTDEQLAQLASFFAAQGAK